MPSISGEAESAVDRKPILTSMSAGGSLRNASLADVKAIAE
jgi:hypothetical protein